MSYAVIAIYINITSFVLISQLEKDHSMIETCRLKSVIFFQIGLSNHLLTIYSSLTIKLIFLQIQHVGQIFASNSQSDEKVLWFYPDIFTVMPA